MPPIRIALGHRTPRRKTQRDQLLVRRERRDAQPPGLKEPVQVPACSLPLIMTAHWAPFMDIGSVPGGEEVGVGVGLFDGVGVGLFDGVGVGLFDGVGVEDGVVVGGITVPGAKVRLTLLSVSKCA